MNKTYISRRKVIIIALVILGILLTLYLGGLIGQLSAGYKNWVERGGFSGGIQMEPATPTPSYCLRFAFTADGLSGVMIVAATTLAAFLYIKFNNKFNNRNSDERNFTVSKTGTYGTAGWMTDKEMCSVLEVTTPAGAKGTILGVKGHSVICLPEDTQLNKHICVFGASGTMKSRAIIRPYLFQCIKRGESVVITDSKTEMYQDLSEMFRSNGYTVKVLNFKNPEHSDSWNCMADLNGDTLLAQILTDVTITNTAGGSSDHFWDNGEGNLLKALILFVDQDPTRNSKTKHLPAVYQMLTQNTEQTLNTLFDRLPISHPAKAPYNLFSQSSDTVKAGIILGLGTRLQVLQNKSIQGLISHSEIDLTEPGKSKCAYFVVMSDQESSTEFLSSLFFSLLFIKLTDYADSTPEQRCKIPVNIVFEEMSNIGRLDSYPRRLSVARSRAIQVCHVVQSLSQFQNRYPDKQWAEIVGNCDTQVMLGCTEEETAKYFSSRSGDMTVEVKSTMTTRQTMAVAQMIPQYRQSDGVGKRRLLTPDEVFRLSHNELLIILRGQKMLRAQKFDYTGHPYARDIVKASVLDYNPAPKPEPILPEPDISGSQAPDKSASLQTGMKTSSGGKSGSRRRHSSVASSTVETETPPLFAIATEPQYGDTTPPSDF